VSAPDPFKIDIGMKLWMAFCLLFGLGFTGVIVWAIIRVVIWLTSGSSSGGTT
jgi:hypothetical protein